MPPGMLWGEIINACKVWTLGKTDYLFLHLLILTSPLVVAIRTKRIPWVLWTPSIIKLLSPNNSNTFSGLASAIWKEHSYKATASPRSCAYPRVSDPHARQCTQFPHFSSLTSQVGHSRAALLMKVLKLYNSQLSEVPASLPTTEECPMLQWLWNWNPQEKWRI